jgi:uncharacterized protein YjbI with pentapeptide repeats
MQKITTESGVIEIIPQQDISNIHFIWIDFSKADFSRKNFQSCTFEKCNLSNVKLKDTTLNDIDFVACKIMWLKFVDITQLLSHFKFSDCSISLCSFYGLKLKGISFQDCKIIETDFSNAYLENAKFSYCDLEKSIFVRCNLWNADFIGSYNFAIDPTLNKFKKTKFSRENSIGLLQHLDIIID